MNTEILYIPCQHPGCRTAFRGTDPTPAYLRHLDAHRREVIRRVESGAK